MNAPAPGAQAPHAKPRRILPAPRGQTIVLTDIRRFHDDQIIRQGELNEYIAWLAASSACVRNHAESEADARKIFDETAAQMDRFAVKDQHIQGRVMLALPKGLWNGREIEPDQAFPYYLSNLKSNPQGRSIGERMKHFAEQVADFLEHAYPSSANESPPDDIVHVTCTGYQAPNAIERMVSQRRWTQTTVTNCYHMGCYAAFPGVRIAHGLLSAAGSSLGLPKSRIDVVHTELVSIHLEVDDLTPGNLVTMTLFGDGFLRYSLVPSQRLGNRAGLELRAATECVLPNTLDEMTWDLTPHAFHMYLSPDVPVRIRDHLPDFIESLARQVPCDPKTLVENAVFAIHPGGPRIIGLIQEALGLRPEQCAHSWAVLRERGNMSSATVPHIWKAILDDERIANGTPIVSMAFGPGLTAAGLIAEKVTSPP